MITVLEVGAWVVLVLLVTVHILMMFDVRITLLLTLPGFGMTVPVGVILFSLAAHAVSYDLRRSNGTVDSFYPALWKHCSLFVRGVVIVLSLYCVAFVFSVAFSYFPSASNSVLRNISLGLVAFQGSSLMVIHSARQHRNSLSGD